MNTASDVNALLYQSSATDASAASVGFSQLLQAADDTNLPLALSGHPMSQVPEMEESDVVDESTETLHTPPSTRVVEDIAASEAGALIVEPMAENMDRDTHRGWLPSLWGGTTQQPTGLHTPLLTTQAAAETPVPHLLSNSPSNTQQGNTPLDRARETVDAIIEDDQSFQVSMTLDANCTVQGVMRILGDPQLLRLWCDPIEALVVTRSSTDSYTEENSAANNTVSPPRRSGEQACNERDSDREYEGEWIEATTTALDSPPSSMGFLYSVGQSMMETIGFTSYGRITMFVERLHGRVGLSIGPFHGGISASHAITVSMEDGRVKVTDRVRLIRDEQDMSMSSFFMCGAFDCCLNQCMLPSVAGHMNQVMTSMARFKLLAQSSASSSGTQSILVVDTPRWK